MLQRRGFAGFAARLGAFGHTYGANGTRAVLARLRIPRVGRAEAMSLGDNTIDTRAQLLDRAPPPP
jgi:hypothetical protein